MSIVEVKDLRKVFDSKTAVDGVTFDVDKKEIFGLLGPNGAGKSTITGMLSCLLEPTSGDASIDGNSIVKEPNKVKKILGVIPQEIALYPTLSARENLHFWGRMYDLSAAEAKKNTEEILEIVGLKDRANDLIETYSGGMKRRINIAAGMLHRPKVLLMDEPTVGIDPQSRNHILEMVKQLNTEGLTVVYTSHYMEEVEFLCDRLAIIDQGKVIAQGTQDELKKLVGREDVIRIKAIGVTDAVIAGLKEIPLVDNVSLKEEEIDVLSKRGREALASVITKLNEKSVKVTSVEIQEPDLEAVFLHLTGKSLRD